MSSSPQSVIKIKKIINSNPSALRRILIDYFRQKIDLNDYSLDYLLDITENNIEKMIDQERLYQIYGNQQYTYEGTPYSYARDFLRLVQPTANDVVYDLGSGYGRVVLFGAAVSPARYVGVEIVPERVDRARASALFFGIKRAEFRQSDVTNADFSNGTIFFLFNPFNQQTLDTVGKQLRNVAAKHRISIVTWGGPSNTYFLTQPWLKRQELLIPNHRLDYLISLNGGELSE